ncbi:MAG: aldo/keto reductase [Bacteroidales bacterium]|nr:MAG: aldo/keto reductase [Bacteroidales bacterium]
MDKVKLGQSEIYVTPIAFGAWAIGGWMWGGADEKDALNAIQRSIDLGVTTIDTAPVYGFGQSEEIIGKAIKGKRDRLQILTKYGLNWNDTRGQFHFSSMDSEGNSFDIYKYAGKDGILEECEASLRRLGTDYIDLYQIHWPDPTTPIQETMEAVEQLIHSGKVRAAGVSNYSSSELMEASSYLSICSNQVPFSMVNRDIETELIPYCMENNISILAYSPLQRGLLTGKIKPNYRFNNGDSRPDTPFFSLPNLIKTNEFLANITPLAKEKGITLAQMVIRWTLQQPGITVCLVGARNIRQVDENYRAIDFELSEEEIMFINEHLENLDLDR